MNTHKTMVHIRCPFEPVWDYYEVVLKTVGFVDANWFNKNACEKFRGQEMTQEQFGQQLMEELSRGFVQEAFTLTITGRHGANCHTTVELEYQVRKLEVKSPINIEKVRAELMADDLAKLPPDVVRMTKVRVFYSGFEWNIDGCDDEGNYTDSCWTHYNDEPLTFEKAIEVVPEFLKEIGRPDLIGKPIQEIDGPVRSEPEVTNEQLKAEFDPMNLTPEQQKTWARQFTEAMGANTPTAVKLAADMREYLQAVVAESDAKHEVVKRIIEGSFSEESTVPYGVSPGTESWIRLEGGTVWTCDEQCTFVRVLLRDGGEIAYWTYEEWEVEPEIVGRLFEAMATACGTEICVEPKYYMFGPDCVFPDGTVITEAPDRRWGRGIDVGVEVEARLGTGLYRGFVCAVQQNGHDKVTEVRIDGYEGLIPVEDVRLWTDEDLKDGV